MVEMPQEYMAIINKPGRVGTLSTADAEGRPNVAYFGSPRFNEDGTFVIGLTNNRTLRNLEVNPYAAFFCVGEIPVTFHTTACRMYLKVKTIERQGPTLEDVRNRVSAVAGKEAADLIKAAVTFEVTELRPLVSPD